MWEYEYTVVTSASAESIFRRWTTLADWVEDDPAVRWVRADGPIAIGTTGTVQTSGPAQRIRFTDVSPNRSMNFAIELPFARVSFPHRMDSMSMGTRLTHGIRIEGVFGSLVGRVIGTKLARDLPHVVRLVADHALADEFRGDIANSS